MLRSNNDKPNTGGNGRNYKMKYCIISPQERENTGAISGGERDHPDEGNVYLILLEREPTELS
jgi:hypothetical protein